MKSTGEDETGAFIDLERRNLTRCRTFVAYIEKTFRDRGLTCSTFQLPRVSLVAVIKRQILEGVQAVVKILRQSQVTGKIPLQVFDHSAGVDNVRYEGKPSNERNCFLY